jgi:hypothetical protein
MEDFFFTIELIVHTHEQFLTLFDPQIEEQEFVIIQVIILFRHLHSKQIKLEHLFQEVMQGKLV